MYSVHVATITTKPGQLRDLLRMAEQDLLPVYRGLPGFAAFTVVRTGDATAVFFGIWRSRQDAEQSVKTSDQWMRGGAGKLIDSLYNRVGDMPFLAVSGTLTEYSSPGVDADLRT